MAARSVCNCCVALSLRNRSTHFGCTRSTTKEEAPAPVHPAETRCLRSPSTAAAGSRSKSVEFANSSGSMPAKHKTLQARPLPKPKPQVVLPQEAREAIALAKVQQLAEQARSSDFDSAPPGEWWKSIAGF